MSSLERPGGIARRRLVRGLVAGGVFIALFVRQAEAEDSEVRIDNFTFTPNLLTVKTGTTVTWVNHDDIPHSIVCPALNLHSHPMDTDATFSNRFDQPGQFDYMCGLHPHMKGRIVVS
jgi:plastocyanin